LLALVLGSSLGFLLIQRLVRRRGVVPIAGVSVGSACLSLVAIAVLWIRADAKGFSGSAFQAIDSSLTVHERLEGLAPWILLLTLCLRYAFWFTARTLRSSSVSNDLRLLAWCEGAFYGGTIAGIAVWALPGVARIVSFGGDPEIIGFGKALALDSVFMLVAATFDYFGRPSAADVPRTTSSDGPSAVAVPLDRGWFLGLVIAFVSLVVAIQLIPFSFAGYLAGTLREDAMSELPGHIIAAFYLGIALASFACASWKPRFTDDAASSPLKLRLNLRGHCMKLPFWLNAVVSVLCIGVKPIPS